MGRVSTTIGKTQRGGDVINIEIEGLKDTMAWLKEVDPKLKRALDAELRGALKMVRAGAVGRIRSRTGRTAAGYKISYRRGGGWTLANYTAPSAILEFAQRPKCAQGASLVNTLNAEYGSPGRILWAAWDQQKAAVEEHVEQALKRIEAEAESRLR